MAKVIIWHNYKYFLILILALSKIFCPSKIFDCFSCFWKINWVFHLAGKLRGWEKWWVSSVIYLLCCSNLVKSNKPNLFPCSSSISLLSYFNTLEDICPTYTLDSPASLRAPAPFPATAPFFLLIILIMLLLPFLLLPMLLLLRKKFEFFSILNLPYSIIICSKRAHANSLST